MKLFTGFLGTLMLSGITLSSFAQVNYPYVGDFETSTTTPSSKSYASIDTIFMNGMPWVMPGVFLGAMTASDHYNGSRGARVRLTNNSSGNPASLEMLANLPLGVGTLSYGAAMYGSDAMDSIFVEYSIDNGTTWVLVGSDAINPITSGLNTYSHTINIAAPVRIKFTKGSTANSRVNMDDITITAAGSTGSLSAIAFTPNGNNVSLATDSLTLTFNDTIIVGFPNSQLYLYKSGQSAPVFSFPASSAVITDNKAVFGPVSLENNTSYYVTLDSNLFKTNASSYYLGFMDTTIWRFMTQDTTPVAPMTTLSETFTNCDNGGAMGVFEAYSIEGPKTWKCSSFGHGDQHSVYFNGGSASGAEASNDWLITSAPLDFSAMNNPELSFYQNRRFEGNVTRSIKVSTNYVPGTDPSTAVWASVSVPALTTLPDTAWNKVENISLNSYKNTPFYLAFVYQCDSTSAWEWTLDDIMVTDKNTSIKNVDGNIAGIQVLGQASHHQINLNIDAKLNGQYELQLFDLLGRNIATQKIELQTGSNRINFNNLNLNSGMHIIRLMGKDGMATVKAVVR